MLANSGRRGPAESVWRVVVEGLWDNRPPRSAVILGRYGDVPDDLALTA
jgi:hypothetical protein